MDEQTVNYLNPSCMWMKVLLSMSLVQIEINEILQAPSSLHQKDVKSNLEVGAFVDIKIL